MRNEIDMSRLLRSSLSEEYVLIFTDHEGFLEFVVCLLLPMTGYLVCVRR